MKPNTYDLLYLYSLIWTIQLKILSNPNFHGSAHVCQSKKNVQRTVLFLHAHACHSESEMSQRPRTTKHVSTSITYNLPGVKETMGAQSRTKPNQIIKNNE